MAYKIITDEFGGKVIQTGDTFIPLSPAIIWITKQF